MRSNENANIGFLKIENRVCVALSRARKGMYIMGNMENLVQSSDIWPKIEEVLIAQESIGQHLELRCQVSSVHHNPGRKLRLRHFHSWLQIGTGVHYCGI